jgi:hypothetical protein
MLQEVQKSRVSFDTKATIVAKRISMHTLFQLKCPKIRRKRNSKRIFQSLAIESNLNLG